jgi:hypothetical protein
MKTPVALALLAVLAFATSPAAASERACRPSLSGATSAAGGADCLFGLRHWCGRVRTVIEV